jgi:hypothetical protein
MGDEASKDPFELHARTHHTAQSDANARLLPPSERLLRSPVLLLDLKLPAPIVVSAFVCVSMILRGHSLASLSA